MDLLRESQLSFLSYDLPSVQEGVMGFYSLSLGGFFVCTLLVYPAHHEKDEHVGIEWGKAEVGVAQQDEMQVPGFHKEAQALGNEQAKDEAEDDGKGYEKMQDH